MTARSNMYFWRVKSKIKTPEILLLSNQIIVWKNSSQNWGGGGAYIFSKVINEAFKFPLKNISVRDASLDVYSAYQWQSQAISRPFSELHPEMFAPVCVWFFWWSLFFASASHSLTTQVPFHASSTIMKQHLLKNILPAPHLVATLIWEMKSVVCRTQQNQSMCGVHRISPQDVHSQVLQWAHVSHFLAPYRGSPEDTFLAVSDEGQYSWVCGCTQGKTLYQSPAGLLHPLPLPSSLPNPKVTQLFSPSLITFWSLYTLLIPLNCLKPSLISCSHLCFPLWLNMKNELVKDKMWECFYKHWLLHVWEIDA